MGPGLTLDKVDHELQTAVPEMSLCLAECLPRRKGSSTEPCILYTIQNCEMKLMRKEMHTELGQQANTDVSPHEGRATGR